MIPKKARLEKPAPTELDEVGMIDTPAVRRSYSFGIHLEYWDPCTDPRAAREVRLPIAWSRHPSAPTDWPERLIDLLDRIHRTRVGRAILRHLRQRTTVYVGDGMPSAEPDPYDPDDGPGLRHNAGPELYRLAMTQGCEAVVYIDPSRPAVRGPCGLVITVDISLVHELIHALTITHGIYRATAAQTGRYRASLREEAYAIVLENMYRDEARYRLRRNYGDGAAVPHARAPIDHSTEIPLTELERRLVLDWRHDMPGFVDELQGIPEHVCRYNPFRAL